MKQPSAAPHYPALLVDIKQRIRQDQMRAVLAVNAELIRLYWGNRADAGPPFVPQAVAQIDLAEKVVTQPLKVVSRSLKVVSGACHLCRQNWLQSRLPWFMAGELVFQFPELPNYRLQAYKLPKTNENGHASPNFQAKSASIARWICASSYQNNSKS